MNRPSEDFAVPSARLALERILGFQSPLRELGFLFEPIYEISRDALTGRLVGFRTHARFRVSEAQASSERERWLFGSEIDSRMMDGWLSPEAALEVTAHGWLLALSELRGILGDRPLGLPHAEIAIHVEVPSWARLLPRRLLRHIEELSAEAGLVVFELRSPGNSAADREFFSGVSYNRDLALAPDLGSDWVGASERLGRLRPEMLKLDLGATTASSVDLMAVLDHCAATGVLPIGYGFAGASVDALRNALVDLRISRVHGPQLGAPRNGAWLSRHAGERHELVEILASVQG